MRARTFGEVLRSRLTELDLSPAARALAAELAAELVRFLRTSLELAGQDYLASRVLGKRRGRPRKSAQARRKAKEGVTTAVPESEATLSETAKGVQEFDSAPPDASTGGRKFDSAPSEASLNGREFDPETGEGFSDARSERPEINEAPNEACTALEEISEGPNEACTAHQKIPEGPCKPCTTLSQNRKIASFQQDTPRSTRQRRRRVAEAILGASKRLLPSALRRFGKGERSRGLLPPRSG